MTNAETPKASDVPSLIYETFLADLASQDVDPAIVEKLGKVLRSGKGITEAMLRSTVEPTTTANDQS